MSRERSNARPCTRKSRYHPHPSLKEQDKRPHHVSVNERRATRSPSREARLRQLALASHHPSSKTADHSINDQNGDATNLKNNNINHCANKNDSFNANSNSDRKRKLTPLEHFRRNQSQRAAERAQRQGILPVSRVSAESRGGRILQKMGWKLGQGLGKTGTGRLSPIPMCSNGETLGLGCVREEESLLQVCRCPKCSAIFDHFPSCYEHMQRLCYGSQREGLPSLEACQVSERGPKTLAFQCPCCALIMSWFAELEEHMLTVCSVVSSGQYMDYQMYVLPSFTFPSPLLRVSPVPHPVEIVDGSVHPLTDSPTYSPLRSPVSPLPETLALSSTYSPRSASP